MAAYSRRKYRSPLKWHGGKSYQARDIIAAMPPHEVYIELFAGGLSVLLNKERCDVELANDIDADLMHFWRTYSRKPELAIALKAVEYNEETFVAGKALAEMANNDILRAVGFLIRNRMSQGGRGDAFGWSDRIRGEEPGDLHAWKTSLANTEVNRDRLCKVAFMSFPWRKCLKVADPGNNALVFADPPYLVETRTAKKVYRNEFGDEFADEDRKELVSVYKSMLGIDALLHPNLSNRLSHIALLLKLRSLPGPVVISGYPSQIYDLILSGWDRSERDIANHSAHGTTKQRRTECLWIKN